MQYTHLAVQISVAYMVTQLPEVILSDLWLELMLLYFGGKKKSCYIIKNLDFSV